jgi:hypothetical protein
MKRTNDHDGRNDSEDQLEAMIMKGDSKHTEYSDSMRDPNTLNFLGTKKKGNEMHSRKKERRELKHLA